MTGLLGRTHRANAGGEEALQYLFGAARSGSPPHPPSVVLLDLKLPKIDGLEVLRRVRADERLKLLPVVILSSSAEERDIIQSYTLGANSYLRKPIDFAEFSEAMRQMGTYWLWLNQSAPV